ncbi:MAG: hypothetical protein JXR34_00375 [Bacteroidales bacterium]|nr:hypothetical protein [Bacteroidales bacterium]
MSKTYRLKDETGEILECLELIFRILHKEKKSSSQIIEESFKETANTLRKKNQAEISKATEFANDREKELLIKHFS